MKHKKLWTLLVLSVLILPLFFNSSVLLYAKAKTREDTIQWKKEDHLECIDMRDHPKVTLQIDNTQGKDQITLSLPKKTDIQVDVRAQNQEDQKLLQFDDKKNTLTVQIKDRKQSSIPLLLHFINHGKRVTSYSLGTCQWMILPPQEKQQNKAQDWIDSVTGLPDILEVGKTYPATIHFALPKDCYFYRGEKQIIFLPKSLNITKFKLQKAKQNQTAEENSSLVEMKTEKNKILLTNLENQSHWEAKAQVEIQVQAKENTVILGGKKYDIKNNTVTKAPKSEENDNSRPQNQNSNKVTLFSNNYSQNQNLSKENLSSKTESLLLNRDFYDEDGNANIDSDSLLVGRCLNDSGLITNIEFINPVKDQSSEIKPIEQISNGSEVGVQVSFKEKFIGQIQPGDYIELNLPKEFKNLQSYTFPIYNDDPYIKVGDVSIIPTGYDGGKVKLTFTEGVSNLKDISGNFYFNTLLWVDKNEEEGSHHNIFVPDLGIPGLKVKPIVIKKASSGSRIGSFYRKAGLGKQPNGEYEWDLIINGNCKDVIENVNIEDHLQEGQSFVYDDFMYKVGNHFANEDELSKIHLQRTSDNSFTLEIDKSLFKNNKERNRTVIVKTYSLLNDTSLDKLGNDSNITTTIVPDPSKPKETKKFDRHPSNVRLRLFKGGGGTKSNPGEIDLKKINEDRKGLNGAQFILKDITDMKNNKNKDKKVGEHSAETKNNGTLKWKNLKIGHRYMIQEKIAPKGYELDSKEYYFILTKTGPKFDSEYKAIQDIGVLGFSFVDKKKSTLKLPETGGRGWKPFLIVAVTSLFFAGISQERIRRKEG